MKSRDNRRTELAWIHQNREMLERDYAGMWIAVDGEELKGWGRSVREASEHAARNGAANPVLTAVRRKEYQGVKLIR